MNSLFTPAVNSSLKDIAAEKIAAGEKTLFEDWINSERHPRDPQCIKHYGVQNGQVVGWVEQKDYPTYVELAQLMREQEAPKNPGDTFGKLAFILPEAVVLDAIARGYDVPAMQESGDYSELYGYIEKYVPELKTTKLKLSKNK